MLCSIAHQNGQTLSPPPPRRKAGGLQHDRGCSMPPCAQEGMARTCHAAPARRCQYQLNSRSSLVNPQFPLSAVTAVVCICVSMCPLPTMHSFTPQLRSKAHGQQQQLTPCIRQHLHLLLLIDTSHRARHQELPHCMQGYQQWLSAPQTPPSTTPRRCHNDHTSKAITCMQMAKHA